MLTLLGSSCASEFCCEWRRRSDFHDCASLKHTMFISGLDVPRSEQQCHWTLADGEAIVKVISSTVNAINIDLVGPMCVYFGCLGGTLGAAERRW